MGEAAGKGKERWPQVRLGDYIQQVRGVSYTPPDVSDTLKKGFVPLFRAHNIQDDGLNFEDLVYVNKKKISKTQMIQAGDILVCASSGSKNLVGKTAQAQIDYEMSFGAFCKVVRVCNDNLDPIFLGHYFKTPKYRQMISGLSSGANINNIRNEHVANMKIPLPPLPEQRRIAAVLDQVSSLIALRKAQLAKLDLLVKARFVEMFGDPVKNEMGWEVGTIGSICSLIYRYPTFYDIEYVDNGVPVVQIRNLDQGGSIDYDKQKYVHITAETNDRYPQTQLQIKDILMAVRGDGSTAKRIGMVTDKALLYANISPNLLLLRTNQKCIPEYLYNYLTSNSGQKYLEKYITKTAKKTITARNIKSITIPIPPPDIQYEFKENIFKMNNLRKIQNRNLHSLNNIRSRLLQECFG